MIYFIISHMMDLNFNTFEYAIHRNIVGIKGANK